MKLNVTSILKINTNDQLSYATKAFDHLLKWIIAVNYSLYIVYNHISDI